MKRTHLLNIAAAGLLMAAGATHAATMVEVFSSPTCGCCTKWIEHLRANGFEVKATDVQSNSSYCAKAGIPDHLGSCHSASVNGYAIEGHVPAKDIKRLLLEKPRAKGLTVPGMPIGSPGMEGPGAVTYEVLLVQPDGTTRVFSKNAK